MIVSNQQSQQPVANPSIGLAVIAEIAQSQTRVAKYFAKLI